MTDTALPGSAPVTDRSVDLRLARLHLRLGALALARAEFESMAGSDLLDDEGIVDLAEVRWRTGDLEGAGEAAAAVVRDDDGPVLALIIAAEAAMARGRPTEARRFATAASRRAGTQLDALFAGMPRAAVWPPDPIAPAPSTATMFDGPTPSHGTPPPARGRTDSPGTSAPSPWQAASAATAATVPNAAARSDAPTSLWASMPAADQPAEASADDPESIFERGVRALAAGRSDDAALAFGLALRMSPALAPAVLDRVLERDEPGLALVRGDAYRLVGRESDARAAYLAAARQARPAETDRFDFAEPDHAPGQDRPGPTPDPQGDSA